MCRVLGYRSTQVRTSKCPAVPYNEYLGSTSVLKRAYQAHIHGWLSKLWSLFGHPKSEVPYYNRDPEADHNFDNHLHT